MFSAGTDFLHQILEHPLCARHPSQTLTSSAVSKGVVVLLEDTKSGVKNESSAT